MPAPPAPPRARSSACAFDATRQRFTENGIFPPPLAGSTREQRAPCSSTARGSSTCSAATAPRSTPRSAQQRAAEADAAAARVLLAVNVARNYVQLARLIEQREVLQRSLTQRDQVLGLIRQRVSAGLDTTVELRQGEGALPETRQQIEALDEQIALARHALAALAGLPPDAADALAPRLAAVRAVPRARAACRPTCSAAVPTSSPRAGASRPRPATSPRRRPSSIRTSTSSPSSACRRSASTGCFRPAASSTASARRSACRSSTRGGCAPT